MISKHSIDKRTADFAATCRGSGIKATHQRMEIFRALAETDEHPDAEALFRRVRARLPSVSLDTVYRTLRLMEQMGVIARLGPMDASTRFDANCESHGHFICTACGSIGDLYDAALDHVKETLAHTAAGRVETVYVELRGLCPACANTPPGARTSRTAANAIRKPAAINPNRRKPHGNQRTRDR